MWGEITVPLNNVWDIYVAWTLHATNYSYSTFLMSKQWVLTQRQTFNRHPLIEGSHVGEILWFDWWKRVSTAPVGGVRFRVWSSTTGAKLFVSYRSVIAREQEDTITSAWIVDTRHNIITTLCCGLPRKKSKIISPQNSAMSRLF